MGERKGDSEVGCVTLRLQVGKKEKEGIKWGKKKILRAIITVISPAAAFRHIHSK